MPRTPYPRRTRSTRASGVMINTLEGGTEDSATTSTGSNPINPQNSNNPLIGLLPVIPSRGIKWNQSYLNSLMLGEIRLHWK